MSYRLLIRPEAELDLEEAFLWYEERSRGLGSEFIRAVDASLSEIQRHPLAHPQLHGQVRRKLLRKFPYGIFYLLEPDLIVVIGCFHVKRDPKQWQRRT